MDGIEKSLPGMSKAPGMEALEGGVGLWGTGGAGRLAAGGVGRFAAGGVGRLAAGADDLSVGRFVDRDRLEVGSKSLGGSALGFATTPDGIEKSVPGMSKAPGMDRLVPGMEALEE